MKHTILQDLELNAQWIDMLKQLEQKIPEITKFTPSTDKTEQWKYDSAFADGCLYILSHLRGN